MSIADIKAKKGVPASMAHLSKVILADMLKDGPWKVTVMKVVDSIAGDGKTACWVGFKDTDTGAEGRFWTGSARLCEILKDPDMTFPINAEIFSTKSKAGFDVYDIRDPQ